MAHTDHQMQEMIFLVAPTVDPDTTDEHVLTEANPTITDTLNCQPDDLDGDLVGCTCEIVRFDFCSNVTYLDFIQDWIGLMFLMS